MSSASSSAQNRAFIPALTSIRFLAGLCVILNHSEGAFGIPKRYFDAFGWGGWLTFFFVLSGFVMTYVYPQFETSTARKKFWFARFARLWPLHALTFLLAILIIPWDALFLFSDSAWSIALSGMLNLAMLHSLIPWPEFSTSYNSVSWSVAVEVIFYLFFPFVLPRFRRAPWQWIAGSALFVLGALIICKVAGVPPYSKAYSGITVQGIFHTWPPTRVLEFLCGAGLALLLERHRESAKKLSTTTWTVLEVIALAGFFFVMAGAQAAIPLMESIFGPAGGAWSARSGALPGAIILVAVFAVNQGSLSKLLSWQPFVFLGETSYARYLLHDIFIRRFRHLGNHSFMVFPTWLQWPMFFASMVLLSYVAWKYFEKPMRKRVFDFLWARFGQTPPWQEKESGPVLRPADGVVPRRRTAEQDNSAGQA